MAQKLAVEVVTSPFSTQYPDGILVQIQAPTTAMVNNETLYFAQWTLNGIIHTENPLLVAMTGDETISALYVSTPMQAGFPWWMLIPIGAIGVGYIMINKSNKGKNGSR